MKKQKHEAEVLHDVARAARVGEFDTLAEAMEAARHYRDCPALRNREAPLVWPANRERGFRVY